MLAEPRQARARRTGCGLASSGTAQRVRPRRVTFCVTQWRMYKTSPLERKQPKEHISF